MRILCSAVLAAALALPGVAAADPVTRSVVEEALTGYESAPDAALVRGWGDEGARLLAAIVRDGGAQPLVRVRAAHALRHFPHDGAARALLRATAASTEGIFLVRACFDALVEGFDDVATVARYLDDARVDVRDGAAWSLASSRNPAARAAMERRLAVEADPTVRTTLRDALAHGTTSVTSPSLPAAPAVTLAPAATRVQRVRAARRR